MRVTRPLFYRRAGPPKATPPLVQIGNATFYRQHPGVASSTPNPPLFPKLAFSLPCDEINRRKSQVWAVVGPSSSGKTTLLEILKGQHLCIPPTARSYPHLSTIGTRKVRVLDKRDLRLRSPVNAIQYVGFGGKGDKLGRPDTTGAYLAARYESRREITDFSLHDYLKGNTLLNPVDEELHDFQKKRDAQYFERAVKYMRLEELLELPVSNLSNGQTRRARIAKAIMQKPRLLLLDEPFLGLDPLSQTTMSPLLFLISRRAGPQIIIALQPQDELPKWITHVMYLGSDCTIKYMGSKEAVIAAAEKHGDPINIGDQISLKWRNNVPPRKEETSQEDPVVGSVEEAVIEKDMMNNSNRWDVNDDVSRLSEENSRKEPLIEMKGVQVSYGDRMILGNWQQDVDAEQKKGLWWNLNRGERWAIFGPNGSGKTTILSLICSDHPQSYSLPITYWGRSRLPSTSNPGISIFDIQARIGHSSPEIHNFFPRHLTVRQTIENSWADTFLSKPHLTYTRDLTVNALLRWFTRELNPSFASARPDQDSDPIDSLSEQPSKQDSTGPNTSATKNLAQYSELDIDWADDVYFRDLSFSSQRVALFLRALAKRPDLVILDESFSGMDECTRIKCLMFLAYGETRWLLSSASTSASLSQSSSSSSTAGTGTGTGTEGARRSKSRIRESPLALRPKTRTVLDKRGLVTFGGFEARQSLLVVSHRKEEVPGLVDRWVFLPEPNSGFPARFGEITREMRVRNPKRAVNREWWEGTVWGPQLDAALRQKERRSYLYDDD